MKRRTGGNENKIRTTNSKWTRQPCRLCNIIAAAALRKQSRHRRRRHRHRHHQSRCIRFASEMRISKQTSASEPELRTEASAKVPCWFRSSSFRSAWGAWSYLSVQRVPALNINHWTDKCRRSCGSTNRQQLQTREHTVRAVSGRSGTELAIAGRRTTTSSGPGDWSGQSYGDYSISPFALFVSVRPFRTPDRANR